MPDLEYLKVLEDSVGQLDPVFRFSRSRNSVCIFDQSASIIALS
jgi:hypothetical protein